MHVVFRESQGLEETETPTDLGQTPADLVVLSFSDSDLGSFAAAWHRGKNKLPTLRLANLAALRHPLSVDTYVEQTLSGAKGILIRLIGGMPYWSYGLQQVQALAQERGIALAVLPADGRADPQLDEVSTLPVSTLRRLSHHCDTGGSTAAHAALAQLSLAAGLYAGPVRGSKALPMVGAWTPEHGLACPLILPESDKPLVIVTFYRAFLSASDLDPIEALFDALRLRGCDVLGLFAPSLKAPDAARWLRRQLDYLEPAAIVNATSFSGKGDDNSSPLDVADVPVFQIALATSDKDAWATAERGLSPSDLAMHVVMPELDGRLFAGVASFKESQTRDKALQFSRYAHSPEPERISAITDKVKAWTNLAALPAQQRRPALVLSTYPGKDWNMAHAVGLDALASAEAILGDLAASGHSVTTDSNLQNDLTSGHVDWPLSSYASEVAKLPQNLRDDLFAVWGKPENDPDHFDGALRLSVTYRGDAVVALQPERGNPALRHDEYHDLSRTPRHGYVAFYLWLKNQCDALVHIGAHGTLEWLPGKSVALSGGCWPEALIGATPVIYPFIVNDPGEAAQAKRRIGAVTLGHIPPPQVESSTPDRLIRLEALLDEFSNADGLDPKRRDRLQDNIRDEARLQGVENDLGVTDEICSEEAITRIDRFVCDIKESKFGDGLHVWGRTPTGNACFDTETSAKAEQTSLLNALRGKRIDAGPSGSPYRGRQDVLPTGRNLYTTDPRSVPTRSAYAQGVKLADELVRRHLQDHGDWPKGLIVDLWGSATMRTAGEEFAMALHLLGTRPVWDEGSERVSGIEVLPIAELERPRIDVTLRVSGLFRDVFPTLSTLFGQAVGLLENRDETADWNPYVGQKLRRVYGPEPGKYGLGMNISIEDYSDAGRANAGEAWLSASSWAIDGETSIRDTDGIRQRIASADSFVHLQDLPETDILLASDYAAHEAGFAAAKEQIGGQAALYHLDNTDPDAPRARALPEEIARVVRARATNPDWISGMMRHGFRGAAEIAATLDHMAAFAHLANVVPSHLFDLYFETTLGDSGVSAFLKQENAGAYAAMKERFEALEAADLWQSRSNSIRAAMEAAE